jgi:hypothetical protein
VTQRRQDRIGDAGFEPFVAWLVVGIVQATKKAAPCKATPRQTGWNVWHGL